MLGEEKGQAPGKSWKMYSRSVSLIERSPKKSNSAPQWNSKARACLPPLQPLSIIRPSIEEWPRAASDDLGVWPNPPTPGARFGSLTPRGNSNSDQPLREFEFKKDRLAFFDKECSRILDHIYVGSNAVAKNREILRQNEITHLLNCVGFICPEYFRTELVYKTLWLQDSPSEDITSILYDVFDYFEDVREQGGRVLVHCYQGVSRSTSLVIAYLIWKDGLRFDDAFQQVKAVRGVTNPNVGFACQLLQWEKRLHASLARPASEFRMYRMAPHSPYDPLHLVPKLLCEPGEHKLDSRGAFIIHFPSALYVWTGKHCPPMMYDNAKAAASQVIKYENDHGPIITVKDGEEPLEFWEAVRHEKMLIDGCLVMSEEKNKVGVVPASNDPCFGLRKLNEYDLDFELFDQALTVGVIPAIPSSEVGAETRLPVRENGWNRFKRKFEFAIEKEFIASSTLNCGAWQTCDEPCIMDTCNAVFEYPVDTFKEDFDSAADLSGPSSGDYGSPDSSAAHVTGSTDWINNELKEVEYPASLSDTSLSCSPPLNLLDPFSRLMSKRESSSTSPSLSPSTSSDYSSSLSPSSSNFSDMSFVSAQPSPYGFNSIDTDPSKSGSVEEIDGILEVSSQLRQTADSPQTQEPFSANCATTACLYLMCQETFPSLAEGRDLASIDIEAFEKT